MINIGNYETERFEASGVGEDANAALVAVRAFVEGEIAAAKLRREAVRRREIETAIEWRIAGNLEL